MYLRVVLIGNKEALLQNKGSLSLNKERLCRNETSHRITKEEKSGKNVANQGIGMETAE